MLSQFLPYLFPLRSLSQQKDFRQIKNAVIKEAEHIRMNKISFEDADMQDDGEQICTYDMSYECQGLQSVANNDSFPLEERDEAAEQLEQLADAGDAHAQYIIGTAYRDGGLLIPDTVKAQKLLERAAEQKIDAAQYALGKLYLMGEGVQQDTDAAYQWFTKAYYGGHTYAGLMFMDRIERGEQRPPSVMLAATRLLYHMGNIFRDNAPIPATTGIRIDHKRLQELQRKRIALGHKPDDHELEQQQGFTMKFH